MNKDFYEIVKKSKRKRVPKPRINYRLNRTEREAMTEERLIEVLLKHVADGNSTYSVSAPLQVSEYTIRQWKDKFPKFKEIYIENIKKQARRSPYGYILGEQRLGISSVAERCGVDEGV
jgi:transposase